MRAVWSFWAKPFKARHGSIWMSTKHYFLSWILSVETAKQHYPETFLYTDDEGASILIDGLGLDFLHVSRELNILDEHDPEWPSLGKLFVYRLQTAPFVHIDSDVFLWKPLPPEVASAPVFAQNPEFFSVGYSDCYLPDKFEAVVKGDGTSWLPEEWKWYKHTLGNIQKAVGCGILGGNYIDFINYYADTAIKLIDNSINKNCIDNLKNKRTHMMLIEQYLLSACIEYHKNHIKSPYRDVYIQYLFDSPAESYDKAVQKGFTHLMGNSKSNKFVAERLEARVKRDHPTHYDRCVSFIRSKLISEENSS